MGESRPSWQRDGCPDWCSGEHGEFDHPDDRAHRSSSLAVPVTVRRTWFEGGSIRHAVDDAEFEVGMSQVDGDTEIWFYVGDGPARSIEIDVQSAARLVEAMAARLRSR